MTRSARPDPADNVVSIAAALDAPIDAPAMQKPDGTPDPFERGDDYDRKPSLPDDAPVQALGLGTDGKTCWYLSRLGQLVDLSGRDHSKNAILMLFSPSTELPMQYWPQWSAPVFEGRGNARIQVKASEIVGFDQAQASEAMIEACGRKGIFDAQGRVRGRGAHSGRGRSLIVHCGDMVMVARRKVTGPKDKQSVEWFHPGVHDGYVYPAGAPVPRPLEDNAGEDTGEKLLALLGTWNWARPDLDAMLALGWAGQSFICGALDWRSHLFVTGGAGTGKSTLNGKGGVFDRLLSGGALRTGNASEAAVRQTLGPQTIPVIFDEFEPNEFNAAKTKAVVELARVASSGAEMHRGGQDHKAHEFTLRSCFQFSAILMPELQAQDRTRFAILELKPFAQGTRAIDLDAAKLPELGRALARRMIDGWPRFAPTLAAYRDGLAAVGHKPRGCDQFGTLLACAHLLLYDHLPDEQLVLAMAAKCAPEGMAEIADGSEEHESCINHIRTSTVQARGGDERESLSTWIAAAIRETDDDKWRRRLEQIGLRIVAARPLEPGPRGEERWGSTEYMRGAPGFLAVAGTHRSLSDLFKGSKWERGAWTQALARTPGAIRGVKIKMARAPLRAVLVPLDQVIDLDDIPGAVGNDEGEEA